MNQNHNHYHYHTYSNGLRLITVPMESTKTVNVLVLVGTGSRYETKDINGISHFLEHMMFKGTKKRPGALDISQELDSIGAEYNAFTSKEYTGYYIKAASSKFDLTLDVISDIFQNSKLDEKEIDKERGVIIEEINMYFDMPRRDVHDVFEGLLYGDQPLGWNIAGEKENINNIQRHQFVDYFNSHYFAGNTIVAVSGNVTPDEVKEKVEKSFNNIREHEKLTALPTHEKQDKPALKTKEKKTDQTNFILGCRAYNMFDDHNLNTAEVLSVILGGNMSSRLFTEVREKRGLAYSVASWADAFTDVGYFGTQSGTDNSRFLEALKVVLDEYKKIANEKIPEKELKKAIEYIKGKTVIGLESSDSMAVFYAEQELLRKEIKTPEEKLKEIEKVTIDDIQKIAQDIFKPEKLNLAVIGPVQDKEEEIQKILNSW
ncbi:MAG: hypothetical protein COV29_04045 [Candidatus Yanofskybacteria bacterium CG10_big_fil_rev_8_21_14_0_10_36_16]|uniref:Peptidase M16 n=1 Tax=Candidatus Yanofskybacteria bacterium CG10_big_fil_rev_8_21_14_0_10_36_16 TaxID=1975096 RepID=A0A2J0Q727_9BACT|nr:MAG: hypothetical protein COV29_04045 [Candidatus Yanofskybacteria bacterium CG10_big_fil_rev_8_21_14_0_10_36_16]